MKHLRILSLSAGAFAALAAVAMFGGIGAPNARGAEPGPKMEWPGGAEHIIRYGGRFCVHTYGRPVYPKDRTPLVFYHTACDSDDYLLAFGKAPGDSPIVHGPSGKCFNPENGPNPDNGEALVMHGDCRAEHTKFRLIANGQIQHVASGKCIRAEDGNTKDPKLILHDDACSNPELPAFSVAHKFAPMEGAPARFSHPYVYFKFALKFGGLCVGLSGSEADKNNPADRTQLRFAGGNCAADPRNAFSMEDNGAIKHALSGKCIHPKGGAAKEGTQAHLYKDCSLPHARYRLIKGRNIQHIASGLCLKPANSDGRRDYFGNYESRDLVFTKQCFRPGPGFAGVQIVLPPAPTRVRNTVLNFGDFCMHPQGSPDYAEDGTPLVLGREAGACGNASKLVFTLERGGALRHLHSGKCVQPKGGRGAADGAELHLVDRGCSSAPARFRSISGNNIQHMETGLCIRPRGGRPANNAKMVLSENCYTGDKTAFRPYHVPGSEPARPIRVRNSILGFGIFCMQPQGRPDYTADRTPMVLGACGDRGPKLVFTLEPKGGLKHVHSGKCVHPKGGRGAADGTELHMYRGCSSEPALFRTIPGGNIQHVESGLCIQPRGGRPADNAQLVLSENCHATAFVPHDVPRYADTSSHTDGEGQIVGRANTRFCVHPYRRSQEIKNNTHLLLHDGCDSLDSRLAFTFVKVADVGGGARGYIKHTYSGKCVHPYHKSRVFYGLGKFRKNTKLVLHDGCGNQEAGFIRLNSGHYKHIDTGWCIHPLKGTFKNEFPVVLYPDCSANHAKWDFRDLPQVENIRMFHKSSKLCVHPKGRKRDVGNNTELVLHKDKCFDRETRLIFRVRQESGDDRVAIQHAYSGKCIHPHRAKTGNGTKLVLYDGCSESHAQFKIMADGSIKHAQSGKCIHPEDGRANPGNDTKLVLHDGCGEARLGFAIMPPAQFRARYPTRRNIENVKIVSRANKKFCFHPYKRRTKNNTLLVLHSDGCGGSESILKFAFIKARDTGEAPRGYIQHVPSGKCVHASRNTFTGKIKRGALLLLHDGCNLQHAAFFRLDSGHFKHFDTGMCIHPFRGSFKNDRRLILYPDCSANHAKWDLKE